MREALEQYIGTARWFGGKGRPFRVAGVRRLGSLGEAADGAPVTIELVTVEYDGPGDSPVDTELYQLPLAHYPQEVERLGHAHVGIWDDEDLGRVFVYDALQDRAAVALWLNAFAEERRGEDLVFHRLEGHELDLAAQGSLLSGEQSNSSVVFGEDSLMKVFRKVTPGRNPDIEIHDALTRAESTHVAALYGWLEAPAAEGEPMQLAMLQQFLRTASDGWDLARASVRDLYAEGDLHADEVGGDFAAESYRLGVATAEVHDALAAGFSTHTWGPTELAGLSEAMRGRLRAAAGAVPELAPYADRLAEAFGALGDLSEPVSVQRVHGDFHLGQTLRTVKGWKIVDFEGEPAKALAERTTPDSPWRDVAGMLRSFDYAALAVEADVEDSGAQIAYRATEWAERNRDAFLSGYVDTSGRTPDGTLTDEQRVLLRAYEVDKVVYETVYEARNRPDWIHIPLSAIARLTRDPEDPSSADDHTHDQEASTS